MQEEIKMSVRFHDRMGNYYKIIQKAYAIDDRSPLYLCQELGNEYELTVWKEDDLKTCLIAENLYEEVKEEKQQEQQVSIAYEKASAVVSGVNKDKNWFDDSVKRPTTVSEEDDKTKLQRRVMAFLEADSYVIKLEILSELRGKLSSSMLETLAISLDFDLGDASLDEQYFALTRYLQTKIRYEQPRRW